MGQWGSRKKFLNCWTWEKNPKTKREACKELEIFSNLIFKEPSSRNAGISKGKRKERALADGQTSRGNL